MMRYAIDSRRSPEPRGYVPSAGTVCLTALWVVLGAAAIRWPGAESAEFLANRERLERMNDAQRLRLWHKYQSFRALPLAEQQRIRRLHQELVQQPPEKRARYMGMMERYTEWKSTLPLYERQELDEAATKDSTALYRALNSAKERQEYEGKMRRYWLVPEGPARRVLPKLLAKLSPEEIELLDQASPVDRTERLLAFGALHGFDVPNPGAAARLPTRGPLPPPDPDRLREFLQKLPREELGDLSDIGPNKAMRERRLWMLYYRKHPEEFRDRLRRGDVPREPARPGRPGS